MKNYFGLFMMGGPLWMMWSCYILSVMDVEISHPVMGILVFPLMMVLVAGLIFHLLMNGIDFVWRQYVTI